jgi:serine/threonine protein kinase
MADVFLGQDGRLGRDVAIKVLRHDKAADPGIRRRFASEGRAAARLSHPNVVGVYDVGLDGGSPYLIMELVTGGTLAAQIDTGPLPQDVVRRIGLDILAGLGAAHEAGILHRDVKPGNVLIDERGTAKLADFGIAKAQQPSDGGDVTATAMVVGTPSYLAPERAEGAPAGVASDLWAVGVVLYEALTAVKPFAASTPLATVLAARQGDYAPLQVRRPDINPALAGAVHRALNPSPAGRYLSAAAMAETLDGLRPWGAPARAAPPAVAASAADDDTAVVAPAPTEILEREPVVVGAVRPRSRGALARLAVASSVAVVAGLLAWALVGSGHRSIGHPQPTTTLHPQVTTTIPATTVPPTTTPSPAPHHGGGGDHGDGHGKGNGGNANGD